MNLYKILGLSYDASIDEIKKAYKKLSMIHHPDRGGDKVIFQQLEEAARILLNHKLKIDYDSFGVCIDEEKEQDEIESNAFELVANSIQTVFNMVVSASGHLEIPNKEIFLIVGQALKHSKAETIKEISIQKARLKKLNFLFKRLSDNENGIGMLYEKIQDNFIKQIQSTNKQIHEFEKTLKVIDYAKAIKDDVCFEDIEIEISDMPVGFISYRG